MLLMNTSASAHNSSISEDQVFIKKPIYKSTSAPNLTLQVIYKPSNEDTDSVSFSNQPRPVHDQQAPRNSISSFFYPIKGYLYAFVFVSCVCISHIFIKMSPTLNSFNHMLIRYSIQLIIMSYFLISSGSSFLGPKNQRLILSIRGFTGMLTLICSYFSIRYLNVSDVESISQCNSLMTAILGRILLKEKLTVCHLLSIFLTLTGVMLILRPAFLFGIEAELESIFHVNLTHSNNPGNQTAYLLVDSLADKGFLATTTGVILSLMSAFFSSVSHIAIKKLCLVKTHFAIISIYPVFFGLPFSLLMSVVFRVYWDFRVHIVSMHVVYSILSGLIATLGLIFLNKALKHEDTAKISILRTSGVLLTFIFQYLILGLGTDFLGILGASLIVFGTFSGLFTKLYHNRIKTSNKFCYFFAIKF